MKTDETKKIPVVWRTSHEESIKRWKVRFTLVSLFYVAIILLMVWLLVQEQKTKDLAVLRKEELNVLRTKENIYLVLRNRGISLNQGLDIADVTTRQSTKLNLPVSLILAVMKKESLFSLYPRSSQNAIGLMQVHPVTWEEYVGKLDLKGSSQSIFDPVTNTIVATHVLSDLYEYYRKNHVSEEEMWKSVLSAYYAGMTSLSQAGMMESSSNYVADVSRFKKEFDEKLQN